VNLEVNSLSQYLEYLSHSMLASPLYISFCCFLSHDAPVRISGLLGLSGSYAARLLFRLGHNHRRSQKFMLGPGWQPRRRRRRDRDAEGVEGKGKWRGGVPVRGCPLPAD